MNGAVAASMRQLGVNFRMNFGVDIPRLKELSLKYEPSKELAALLWSQEVRELKILATMLFPPGEMAVETANSWAGQITNQEIREQACKNLFQELPFANILVGDWSVSPDEDVRTTAYWLFTRLCINRSEALDRIKTEAVLKRAVSDLKGDSILLYQSALNALRFYGRLSREHGAWVLREVSSLGSSEDSREKEMYDQLQYEFDYSLNQ